MYISFRFGYIQHLHEHSGQVLSPSCFQRSGGDLPRIISHPGFSQDIGAVLARLWVFGLGFGLLPFCFARLGAWAMEQISNGFSCTYGIFGSSYDRG